LWQLIQLTGYDAAHRVHNAIFEMWMKLHSKIEEMDGRRKAKWENQPYVPYHGTRKGQLTYGKVSNAVP